MILATGYRKRRLQTGEGKSPVEIFKSNTYEKALLTRKPGGFGKEISCMYITLTIACNPWHENGTLG